MPPKPERPTIDDRVRIEHMRLASRDIIEFVKGRTRQDLDTDAMLCRALTNAVQQIGEAAAKISDEARARVPDIPWGQIVAMRHVLVHVYWGVDHDRLWVTATDDVPLLVTALEDACRDWPLPDVPGSSPS